MTAKVIRLPVLYPRELDGVSISRRGDTWTLRHSRLGRCFEVNGLTTEDLRDLKGATALVLDHLSS